MPSTPSRPLNDAESSSAVPADVTLEINPSLGLPRVLGATSSFVSPPPEEESDQGLLAEMASASTLERRQSATQRQNEAQWARMRRESAPDEVADVGLLFPTITRKSLAAAPDAHGSLPPRRPSGGKDVSSVPAVELASASEWSAANGRPPAMSMVSFMSPEEQSAMLQLPAQCTGAAKLVMPAYLTGQISNVTLPSRLDLLGRRGFKILGALFPRRVGNSVLGWSPVLTTSWRTKEWRVRMELFHLPWLFSKSFARIHLYLRIVFIALFVILLLDVTGAANANPGRVWAIGTIMALGVMWKQSQYRRAPDGVMAFCRSLGAPDIEEYMFSYCWKHRPDDVRTLAKAVWHSGVGVWIDVVKLCPGDEIRPMVRTTVRRVHKVVIFLCDEYCVSPNCCVELLEAVQHPEKCTVCVIKDNVKPEVMDFLRALQPKGLRMCTGFNELISLLDFDMQDMTDVAAFQWWRSQAISGAGVPSTIVPSSWPISRFSLRGKVILPEKSVDVGPVYVSGDLKSTGASFTPPWLLVVALIAIGINAYDMYDKWTHSAFLHTTIDYFFLCVIAGCNCAPFIGFNYLLDRRRDAHVALRPLLASRSMGKDGIKVRVCGSPDDPICATLRTFLATIGHLAPDVDDAAAGRTGSVEAADGRRGSQPGRSRCVTVHVMESLRARDLLFGPGAAQLDNRFSLFIWSGSAEAPGTLPFTDDATGQKLMRYLTLVADWEKHGLAESLFSAIGVRVVDILHEKPSRQDFLKSGAMGSSARSAKALGMPAAHFEPKVQAVAEEES